MSLLAYLRKKIPNSFECSKLVQRAHQNPCSPLQAAETATPLAMIRHCSQTKSRILKITLKQPAVPCKSAGRSVPYAVKVECVESTDDIFGIIGCTVDQSACLLRCCKHQRVIVLDLGASVFLLGGSAAHDSIYTLLSTGCKQAERKLRAMRAANPGLTFIQSY